MKNCPECSAVLDDKAASCPYCGSDLPTQIGYMQTYSMDDKTALKRARITLAIAIISLVINPIYITTIIASNLSSSVKRSCNPNNKQVLKICSAASTIAGLAVVISPIVFFIWLGAVVS